MGRGSNKVALKFGYGYLPGLDEGEKSADLVLVDRILLKLNRLTYGVGSYKFPYITGKCTSLQRREV